MASVNRIFTKQNLWTDLQDWKPWISKLSFIASDSANNQLFTEQFAGLGFYRRIIEWNKIFMAILQKQKELFYWNNVNIRQTVQTLKQRFFTDLKQKQNVKFLYLANVTEKQIGYKYQRQLFGTNQYFIVNIFPRGKSCFV